MKSALHAAGNAYSYANTHHTLLGLLIEQVTGRSAESTMIQLTHFVSISTR